MTRILVTEKIAEAGLAVLRDAGHEVDVQIGLDEAQLREKISGASGLLIRSATQVDKELLAAADSLVVVGRAGVGLDNVDVDAATSSGVLVANAPTANSISAAEHTLAMLLASARNIPQAHQSLQEGRWDRSSYGGVELYGKTLGVVGLGNIGGLVAERASAFGMTILGHDPFVDAERADSLGVKLLDLDEVVRRGDFLTLTWPARPRRSTSSMLRFLLKRSRTCESSTWLVAGSSTKQTSKLRFAPARLQAQHSTYLQQNRLPSHPCSSFPESLRLRTSVQARPRHKHVLAKQQQNRFVSLSRATTFPSPSTRSANAQRLAARPESYDSLNVSVVPERLSPSRRT